jgi:predicted cupin superfamily sugar epimerase
MKSAEEIIEALSLSPHPEGGWFRRTYESSRQIESACGIRPLGTSILYLLQKGEVSCLHKLDADETWYFHEGAPLDLHLFEDDKYQSLLLGNSAHGLNIHPQVTIPAGTIFGALPIASSNEPFSLVSCSVCPGFIADGFSWAQIPVLTQKFKKHSDIIVKLSPPVES